MADLSRPTTLARSMSRVCSSITTDSTSTSVDMVALAHSIVGAFPPGHADLADQLKRASTSIALNIAEGAGEYSRADKARSGTESAAIVDVAQKLEIICS